MTQEEQRLSKICHDYSMIVATLYRDLESAKDQLKEAGKYHGTLKDALAKCENARQNWRNLARGLQEDAYKQRKDSFHERPIASEDTNVGV